MEFRKLRDKQQGYFERVFKDVNVLFTVDIDKDVLWNAYLDSFPPGTNEVFRKNREFDCSCCRSFIKKFGNVVAVIGGEIYTIWGFQVGDATFLQVMYALDKLVSSAPINGVFVTKETTFGADVSREVSEGQIISWNHFFLKLPRQFVLSGNKTVDDVAGEYATNRGVFERSLQQISIEAVETVLDLISQNSLYRGEEWKSQLERFLVLKKEYDKLGDSCRNNWCWVKSVEAGPVIGRIKNHSIGTLLLDLTDGTELDEALRKYEKVVAPSNYKRPQAIFTARMVEQARRTVIELGLENSLQRRFAKLEDITINDVLFADRSVSGKMRGDVFSKLSQDVPINPKSYEKVEEVPADRFINDVLPRATGLSVLVENRHLPNFVSLIAPQDSDAPGMFKWPNNFSWAYTGNIADSMKERVAAAGGKVDGVLRFSIQWNEKGDNQNDFDAHCVEPDGNHIYFSNKGIVHRSSGQLDVDIIRPGSRVAVENITWSNAEKMREGIYKLYVHCFSHNGGKSGFAAEIEYGGQVWQFEYRKDIPNKAEVIVAKLRFSRANGLEFIESLPDSLAPKTVWGITTHQFVPVLAVMNSPNYWNGWTVGNRHTIFALKGCINDTQPNGFFNEYLDERLMPHRKVFEALGREMRVEPSEEQLSGLGFASTRRNHIIVKVSGNVDRVIRVTF